MEEVSRRIILGHLEPVTQVMTTASGGQHQVKTAYIERLNATFRAALASLARRTCALAHRETFPSCQHVSGRHGRPLCLAAREPASAHLKTTATVAGTRLPRWSPS